MIWLKDYRRVGVRIGHASTETERRGAQVYVWDPFVRVFHWLLVTSFAIAYLTENDMLTVHIWAGYTVGILIVARILWGFFGPAHARFGDFDGVAAAAATKSDILLAGVAGLVAGAMSMAAGEYVSVSSQSDTEQADLVRARGASFRKLQRSRKRNWHKSTSIVAWNPNSLGRLRFSLWPRMHWGRMRETSLEFRRLPRLGLSKLLSRQRQHSRLEQRHLSLSSCSRHQTC